MERKIEHPEIIVVVKISEFGGMRITSNNMTDKSILSELQNTLGNFKNKTFYIKIGFHFVEEKTKIGLEKVKKGFIRKINLLCPFMKNHYQKVYKYCDIRGCKFAHSPIEIELIHPKKKLYNLG